MKKLICLILILVLLLSLSLSAFALGNSYTYTSSWFRAIFDNAVVSNNSSQPSFSVSGCAIGSNGIAFNYSDDYNTTGVFLKTSSSVNTGTLSVTIPLNVVLYRSVEYLELEFYTVFSNFIEFTGSTVRVGSSNLSTTSTVSDYDNLQFGSIVYASPSANVGTFEPIVEGRGQKINIRYFKNLSSSEQTVDSITLNFNVIQGSQFALGVPCVDSLVNLPDSFYDAIYSIKIFEVLRYNQMSNLLTDISEIQAQLDEILGSIESSGGSTDNYYNTIINQSPEQAAVVQQLQSDLEAAKEEFAEIQEVITSVPAPEAEDIFSTSTSTSSEDYISDALSDNTVLDLFTYFFNNSFVIMAFGVTITIATVSYILYGKKG